MQKLLLFDIDGTLVCHSTAHKTAFKIVFKKLYNVEIDWDTTRIDGMTDQQIMKVFLNDNKLDYDKIPEMMNMMIEEFNKLTDTVELIPGVEEALQVLTDQGHILGNVTGNLEPIAHGKLKNLGIDHYFKLGGYGSDHEIRSELVKIAVQRAKDKLNFIESNNVYYIGDTPRDIYAAKEAGVIAVGAATSRFTKEQLEEAGADIVYENASNVRVPPGL